MSRTRTQHVFRNFLLVYISFALCMMLILIPLYVISLREAEKRTLDTATEMLSAGMDVFEEALSNAATAADVLYTKSQVYTLAFLSHPLAASDAYTIYEGLKTYKTTADALPLTLDSGMHFYNDALIAGNRFFLPAQDAFDPSFSGAYIYRTDDAAPCTFAQWLEALQLSGRTQSLTGMRMTLPARGTLDAVVYAISLPLNTPAQSTFFYSIYDERDLLDLLVLPQYQNACTLTLRDAAGAPFLSYASAPNDRFVEIAHRSAGYHLNASLRISTTVFSRQLQPFRSALLVCALSYILIGLLLALFFSWRNARPMVRVIHAAEQTGLKSGVALPDAAGTHPLSSYQYIHTFIDGMGKEVTDSHLKLKTQMAQLQESMLDRLLRGDLYHESSRRQAQCFFPDFPPCCLMIGVRILHSHQMDLSAFTAAQIQLEDILRAHLPPETIVHFFFNLAVLLCPCGEEDARAQSDAVVARVMPPLNQTALEVKFAVSPPFHGVDALSSVFQQLRHLLHITGDSGASVVYAQDIRPHAQRESGNSSTHFYEMLLRGECDAALALMDQDVQALKTAGMTNETDIQQLFFLYRHALVQFREDMHLNSQDDLPLSLPGYLAHWSMDEMFGELRRYCLALCDLLRANRLSAREHFERSVLAYIDEHLSETDLCVRAVVDQFHISESTLRNILQKTAGLRFSEYVESHRMHRAELLVTHSALPVSQIPAECGYASANTFYKAFKRCFGMSPSTLRAQAQSESSTTDSSNRA